MADAEVFVGQGAYVLGTYTDLNTNQQFDPAVAVVIWRTPDRTIHTGTPDRVGLGRFRQWFYFDRAGDWKIGYRTGPDDLRAAAKEITVKVKTELSG